MNTSPHRLLFAATIAIGVFATSIVAQGQQNPMRVRGLTQGGLLTWTNNVLTTAPVYDVVVSTNLPGNWVHYAYVTNQNSLTITNPPVRPSFYKVGWIGDTPTQYSYVYDEGFGEATVIGTFNLTFVPGLNLGTWSCQEVYSVYRRHPVGNGTFVGGGISVSGNTHSVRLLFTPLFGDSGTFLEGVMQVGTVNGNPAYTGFSGTVYENGIAGPSPIGTFTATRQQ
jgi:hypothetical protein